MLLLNEYPPRDCGLVAVSTSGAAPRLLLVATEGAVACFAAAAAAAAAVDAAAGAVRLLWRHRIAGSRVLHVVALEPDCSAYLLVTSPGPRAPPQAAVVVVHSDDGGAGTAAVAPASSWPATPRQAVAAQVALGVEAHAPDAVPAVPVFSNLERCGGGGFVLAACVAVGNVHLLRVQRTPGGAWQLEAGATQLGNRVTTDPGAAIVVESLSLSQASQHLAPAAAADGGPRLQAAILYCSHWLGGGVRVKHVACLEVEGTAVQSCCWFLRNVDPSTSLVAALPGARTLVAAADRLTLMRHDALQERQVLLTRPMAHPTCAVALSPRLVAVGDAAGGLLLLDLEEGTATGGPALPSPASCLAFLPAEAATEPAGPAGAAPGSAGDAAAAAEVPEGLLYVGSTSSGSTLLQLPAWQAAPLGDAAQLAALVAPISSASLFHDDCGDPRLLACCGQPPHARLALGRLGAALHPLASGGDDLPGLVRLLGVKSSPGATYHRYLLLSCDASAAPGAEDGWTIVLEAAGGELRAAELPGLQLGASTLLASTLQGGCMLQVTQQAVHVFRPAAAGAALSTWLPPGGGLVSLAALQGQYLALACGSAVQVLYCGGTGRLQEECQVALPQQASALALFELGGGSQEVGAEVWLAAGLWVSNEVLLQPLSADQPARRLQLGACQPRSLAVLPAGSSTYLVVGASSGEVLMWRMQVQRSEFGGSSGVQLEEHGWVRAGAAPVTLHLLPITAAGSGACGKGAAVGSSAAAAPSSSGPFLVAVSDQALLLATDPVRASRVAVARLHGGQAVSAACPLISADLPGSGLAYVQGGRLHIGSLDPAAQVRWDELALAGAAAATVAAFLPATGTAAVACTDADGSSSLRLVDAAALQELLKLPMPARCCVTAMAAAHLPCSSGWEQQPGGTGGDAAAARAVQQAPGCKQFLLVALGAAAGAPAVGEAADEEQLLPPASTADTSQPWWRQQQPQPQQQQQQPQHEGASQPQNTQPAPGRAELRVYEVRRRPSHASSSHAGSHGNAAALELVLHGACPVPTAAFSLAAVQPDPEPFDAWLAKAEGSSPGAASSAPSPAAGQQQGQQRLLAAGCHDGAVRLYRLFVDDAGLEARLAVEAGLAAIAAAVEPLGLTAEEGERGAAGQHATAPATAAGRGSGAGLWSQQVALQLIAKAPTCFEGLPTELTASGSTLYARDLLSSLTAYQVQPLAPGRPATLIPLGADLTGRHLGAAMPLGGSSVLAAAHGSGLLLLQRDPAAERARQAAARQRWQLARELGGETVAGGAAAVDGAEPRYTPSMHEAVQLDVAASHQLPGSVAATCPGLLGVPLRHMAELPGGGSGRGSAGAAAEAGQGERQQQQVEAATVVCTSGAVLSARLLAPEQHRTLWQLQRAAEGVAEGDTGRLEVGAAQGGGDDALGRCVDGDALVAAFLQPAWHQRLLRATTAEAAAAGHAALQEMGML